LPTPFAWFVAYYWERGWCIYCSYWLLRHDLRMMNACFPKVEGTETAWAHYCCLGQRKEGHIYAYYSFYVFPAHEAENKKWIIYGIIKSRFQWQVRSSDKWNKTNWNSRQMVLKGNNLDHHKCCRWRFKLIIWLFVRLGPKTIPIDRVSPVWYTKW